MHASISFWMKTCGFVLKGLSKKNPIIFYQVFWSTGLSFKANRDRDTIEIQSFSSGLTEENCFIVFLALLIDTLSRRRIVVIASVCPAGGVQLLLEMKEMVIVYGRS